MRRAHGRGTSLAAANGGASDCGASEHEHEHESQLGSIAEEDADTDHLIARYQAGGEDAFRALYLRYFDRIYAYLHVMLRDRHEAEDLAQDVFAQLLRSLPRYEIRSETPARAWLFRVARNHGINRLRQHKRLVTEDPETINDRRAPPDVKDAMCWTLSWITDYELHLLLERLPLSQRQVLMLHYRIGLELPEIAVALERTTAAVHLLHHRALRTLENQLATLGRKPGGQSLKPTLIAVRQATVLRARRFALARW
jgi:RNA polymerase sigma-70 factor (ECF subfamily)